MESEDISFEGITGKHHQQLKSELGAAALKCHGSEEEDKVEEEQVNEPPKRCSHEGKLPKAKLCFYTILIFVSYTIYVSMINPL